MGNKSLRIKLTLAYVSLAIVCALALGAAGIWLQQRTYLNHLRERLAVAARVATDAPQLMPLSGADLDALTRRLAVATEARVAFIGPDGRLLADSAGAVTTPVNLADEPEVAAALASVPGQAANARVRQSTSDYIVATPVWRDGALLGIVRFTTPLTEVNAALQRLGLMVIGLSVLGALLTGAITLGVTRALTVPLQELATMVRRMTTEHPRERLPVRSDDELGQLAASVNQMADELDATIHAISNQRDEMSALLGGMPDAILVVDLDLRVRRINPAALRLFAPKGTSAGMPLIELTRDHELVGAVEESLRVKRTTRQVIERGTRPRVLSVTTTPVAAGDLIGALITLHDVSEMRRLEQARRQFVANVSHELRTPLSNIKLMVETLAEDPSDVELVADYLERINTEIDSLTQLVRELLELARLESGQAPLALEPVRMDQLIVQVVERLRPQAERQGVTLTPEPTLLALPPVEVDRQRMLGVLVNLVHNAIKFTPPGGAVMIGGEVRSPDLMIWVRDTGVGIASAELPRVFERFYKVDRSRTAGGAGLGLAIVKHTVQAHGGRVWAESVVGQGSTFLFTLPLRESTSGAVEAREDSLTRL